MKVFRLDIGRDETGLLFAPVFESDLPESIADAMLANGCKFEERVTIMVDETVDKVSCFSTNKHLMEAFSSGLWCHLKLSTDWDSMFTIPSTESA